MPAVRCPFCRSEDVELHSMFGSTLLVMQYYCRACHTVFEYLRDEEPPLDPTGPAT